MMKNKNTFLSVPYSLLKKTELNLSARLVLALILSLSEKKGCFASNAALGDILGISERVIAENIRTLKDGDYISTRVDGRVRHIYPARDKLNECGISIPDYAESAPEEVGNSTLRTRNPHPRNAESAQYNNNYNNKYKNSYKEKERENDFYYSEDTRPSYDIDELERIR